jgi:hypothetical protein
VSFLPVLVTSAGSTCECKRAAWRNRADLDPSPEDDSPFYRATVFSNYSPNNCPQADALTTTIQTADPTLSAGVDTTTARPGPYWSLMLEVSQSKQKPVDEENLLRDCMQGMINTGLLQPGDEIVSTYHRKFVRSPSLSPAFLTDGGAVPWIPYAFPHP